VLLQIVHERRPPGSDGVRVFRVGLAAGPPFRVPQNRLLADTLILLPYVHSKLRLCPWGAPSLMSFQGRGFWYDPLYPKEDLQASIKEGNSKSPALQNAKDGAPQVQLQRQGHPSWCLILNSDERHPVYFPDTVKLAEEFDSMDSVRIAISKGRIELPLATELDDGLKAH
jgi:hypothetical protein